VGTIADPKAPNGARRSMFAIDIATGALAWSVEADAISRGAHARLVRAGSITVAASAYGEAAVDDTGTVRWSQSRKESTPDSVLGLGGRGGPTVVIANAPRFSTSDWQDTPRHFPLLVRTLDVETGVERGRHELPAMGDTFQLGELAVAGDGRLVIEASDITWTKQEVMIDGKPVMASAQDAKARLIVIDGSDPAKPRVESIARPERIVGPLPAKLAPSEVVFLDRYATPKEPLGVTIVDLATSRARLAIVMRPERVAVGEGVDSYVQIMHLASDGDRLSFAGHYIGVAAPLRAIVREVDACEARGFIECSEGVRTTTIAPSAGVIGTIQFAR
jgi:hypothetical protein